MVEKFLNCSCHEILLELSKQGRKEVELLVHVICCVTWVMRTELLEIPNHNERSSQREGAYVYTKLQTHFHCCYGWLNSLSQTLLHSHCSNTINIFTVVMLLFRWCKFNTVRLAWGLCFSLTKFPVWFQFNIPVYYVCGWVSSRVKFRCVSMAFEVHSTYGL